MRPLQRFLSVSASLLLLCSACGFSACGQESESEIPVLRVYNWEDYISDEDDEENGYIDLISAFEEEYGVKVEYSTFGTNKNMYNELLINSSSYDLVCPSDYMIMKMIHEDMVEPFTDDFFTETDRDGEFNYYTMGVSPYIAELFETNGWTRYAAAYMWGTMGFLYDPDSVLDTSLTYWTDLDNEAFQNKFTLKDSVRDTYFLAVAYVYHDELLSLGDQYENGELSDKDYTAKIVDVMNRTDPETISAVQAALRKLKKNAYGFEVDSGKNDMVTGKISVNFCWSGDAAYSIYEAAEENDKTLYYTTPAECTNVWFDGWVIPKGGNVTLAQKFLNFISRPESAIANMNYIGYTSSIAGAEDEVLEWVLDSYALAEEDIDEDSVLFDLSYFFGEGSEAIFYAGADDAKGMLVAQFPTEDIIRRSAIMQFFEEEANNRINMMWEDVKGAEVPLGAVIFIVAVAGALVAIYVITKYGEHFVVNKPKKGFRKIEK